jgi:hypothetical protein
MSFGDDYFEKVLPNYLVEPNKSRLKRALQQFIPDERNGEIDYSDFYKTHQIDYFLQSDLVKEIRIAHWNEDVTNFDKKYTDAVIISNTCDISLENKHDLNQKQCLFAPLINFNSFLTDLRDGGYSEEKIVSFSNNVKSQLISNLFYFPLHNKEKKEYLIFLDKIFWFPTSELNSYTENIEDNRISSLTHFGFYLFILKLSYHLCRLPEQCDRNIEVNRIPV